MRSAKALFLDQTASDEESLTTFREPALEESARSLALQDPSSTGVRKTSRLAVLAGVAAAAVVAVGLARRVVFVQQPLAGKTVGLAAAGCHTAVKGEDCHVDVMWAMNDGIHNHPEYYDDTCPSLTASSSFEDFQACVYKIDQTSCPLPCNPANSIPVQEVEEEEKEVEQAEVVDERAPCHIAQKGEQCFVDVVNAMRSGLTEHPEKFPGLTQASSFEEFQAALHLDPSSSSCPPPCACKTSVEGEACFKHVMWAKQTGIPGHGVWYHGVTEASTFEEIQMYMMKSSRGLCGLPCTAIDLSTITPADLVVLPGQDDSIEEEIEEDAGEIAAEVEQGGLMTEEGEEELATEGAGSTDDEPLDELGCHTTVKGQSCYDDVLFGMEKGIQKHPEWYPQLTPSSSFEDFQKVLHKNKELNCPVPCACRTAQEGEDCYSNIKWVLHKGIEKNPSWYKGLTSRSRFEEIQERLLEDVHTTCDKPCTPSKWGKPSLFCFSVFRSTGYELDLVKALLAKNVGIFGCDQFAVLSDKILPLSKGVHSLQIPPCETVGVSKDGTAANTLIFMKAWTVIYEDMRWRAHDWVIKADPDAVLLPDRLRTHLKPHTGKNVFVKNCMKYTGPGWPMMFGSLEAFAYKAMEAYFKDGHICKDTMDWQAWGEDLFMGNCLEQKLGVSAVYDGGLIGDNVCKGANCADGNTAAYHPFKSAEKWFKCYEEAMR